MLTHLKLPQLVELQGLAGAIPCLEDRPPLIIHDPSGWLRWAICGLGLRRHLWTQLGRQAPRWLSSVQQLLPCGCLHHHVGRHHASHATRLLKPGTLDPGGQQWGVLIAVQLPHAAILSDRHRVINALAAQETTHLVRLFLLSCPRICCYAHIQCSSTLDD